MFFFSDLHSSQKLRLQQGVMTASTKTRLHKRQRRSSGGESSSADFVKTGTDIPAFLSSVCRAISANASAFFSILSTYNSL